MEEPLAHFFERKFGSVKLEKMVSLKESLVGHHNRTGAVLCIIKNGDVRGKSWRRQPVHGAWDATRGDCWWLLFWNGQRKLH